MAKSPEVQISNAYSNLLSIFSIFIQITGIFTLLVTHVWWAALLIFLFTIPLLFLAVKSGKANYAVDRLITNITRKNVYLSELLTSRDSVEERALFGYESKLNQIYHTEFEKARKIELKTKVKWNIRTQTGGVLFGLISIMTMVVLLQPVLTGIITIGLFISLINAVFSMVPMMSWRLTSLFEQLAKNREYLKDFTKFSFLKESPYAIDKPINPVPVFESLEFTNVRFKYPGTEHYILNGLSLRIEAGKHYAFVGVNGAGKTTITKLITGLYDDFEGEILLNGKSIKSYNQSEFKGFFANVYQDFAKYSISIKDNIAVGNVNGMNDNDTADQIAIAVERVGLIETVNKLPNGLETWLGKIKENSQDLSGGEWQRVAMARAIYNPAPIQILDEPAAALDPISESRLYEEF